MPKKKRDDDNVDLDELIEEITVDAHGDDEKLWAFRQVIEDEVDFPVDGFIIDEPVRIIKIDSRSRASSGFRDAAGATRLELRRQFHLLNNIRP